MLSGGEHAVCAGEYELIAAAAGPRTVQPETSTRAVSPSHVPPATVGAWEIGGRNAAKRCPLGLDPSQFGDKKIDGQ